MALDLFNTKALYVHIPFCDTICSYCDFCKVLSESYNHLKYLDVLKDELSQYDHQYYETIYIGGGTPSSLSYKELQYLFEILKPYTSHVLEYSIEANPESLTEDKIQLMQSYGINRVSIGVQTFNLKTLKLIQRNHNKQDVKKCVSYLHDYGINDINIDLIYGLPGNDLSQTLKDIDQADALNISHISVYSFILEEHTLFKVKGYQPLSDLDDAIYYDAINKHLASLGYQHYEVSNYYKIKPSLHNLVYWHYEDYLSVGLGAHYKAGNQQIENTRSMEDYLNHQYVLNVETLTKKDIDFNRIMMSLRLKEGIHIQLIDYDYYSNIFNQFINEGYMQINNDYISLTYKGLFVLDTLLLSFL